MILGELISQLQALVDSGAVPADSPVMTEGCDCGGVASKVVVKHGEVHHFHYVPPDYVDIETDVQYEGPHAFILRLKPRHLT